MTRLTLATVTVTAAAVLTLQTLLAESAPGAGFATDTAAPSTAAPAAHSGDWPALLAAIPRPGRIRGTFTELRWFPFRKVPTRLQGQVRLDPVLGLSLHYPAPLPRTVIVDDLGVLLRAGDGPSARERSAPAGEGAADLPTLLLPILRLDADALRQAFTVSATVDLPSRSGTLTLVPVDAAARHGLDRISVRIHDGRPVHIDLRRSELQRVEVLLDPPEFGVSFSADETHAFFRRP